MSEVVICPKCLTATTPGSSEGSPYRAGKRCWRCPGRYVVVHVPALSREELIEKAATALHATDTAEDYEREIAEQVLVAAEVIQAR